MSRQILIDKLSEDNLLNCAEEFLQTLTFSDNDRMNIEKATVRQHKNKTWQKVRHLLVTMVNKKSQISFSIWIYSYSEMPIENDSYIQKIT